MNAELELIDITKTDSCSVAGYDIVGFAFFTDSWQPPKIYSEYTNTLTDAEVKYAFIFDTYGCISGKSVKTMYTLLKEKEMKIVAFHSLHTPENYPPMIAAGKGYKSSPGAREMKNFLDLSVNCIVE